jgi:hypothetical protein
MINISVTVSDFTTIPGGRFIKEGDGSAEEFFLKFIKPRLAGPKRTLLEIDMNGTWGYPPSFTSQLGIYLKGYFGSFNEVLDHVTIRMSDPETSERFWSQLEDDTDGSK